MFKKYLHYIVLFTAIINTISCANEIRQNDIIDGDNRDALGKVFLDSFLNMKQLRQLNPTIKEIHLNDDWNVNFHNITFTPLLEGSNTLGLRLTVECILDTILKISIPLGYFEIKGSLQTTKDNEIYHFEAILWDVEANITMHPNPQITHKIDITIQDFVVGKLNENIVTAILHSQTAAIKLQILDQLYDQIKEDDLLSYFSTAKNYCFHSQSAVDSAKQYYLINRTHVITPTGSQSVAVKWIKINNFYLNFTLKMSPFSGKINYYFFGRDYNATYSAHYYDDEMNSKNPTEYIATLRAMEVNRSERKLGKRFCPVKSENKVFEDAGWVMNDFGVKLNDIIADDLDSFLGEKYDEFRQVRRQRGEC